MEEDPGSSSQPSGIKTRRQHHHNHHHHQRQHAGKRIKYLVKYLVSGRKLSRWIVSVMVLLAISTMSIKIMLMDRFGRVEDESDRNDFRQSSQETEKTRFVTETTSHPLHGERSSREEKGQELWVKPRSDNFYRCPRTTKPKKEYNSKGYILVRANGGLNQMKAGIADMVAVAKIMDATMILPTLDHNSYWSEPSEFKDIFDWKHFIAALKDDVQVLESLPPTIAKLKPVSKVPISWSKASYYRDLVPLLERHHVIKFTHTDSRLANNGLVPAIQRLRCHAMYEALRLSSDIQELAQKLIRRLREHDNRYLALHLRYGKDMLAFTGCDHNLTRAESDQLQKLRYKVKHWKQKQINSTEQRLHGRCPMTPREAALFLHALGFSSNTTIYIASGEIFGESGLSEFKKKFPKTFSHSTLATEEEFKPFLGRYNKLSALDYAVAVESDVFTYTYYGNLAKAVRGHRMFLDYRKSVDPDMPRFIRLVDQLEAGLISEEEFSLRTKSIHKNRIGGPSYREVRKPPRLEEPFYANPYPGCICER